MIGQTISHYKILEKLGEGGMGVVYKAQDIRLNRPVALKFLSEHLSASERDNARFLQEARAAASLNHPNICTIYGIDEHEGHIFIAMEFVEGETLREKCRSFSVKQTVDIGAQIAEGLAAAHERGIVHRDLKPENIMIRRDGIAQIMDFGLAKLRDASVSRLTQQGSTVGTAGYMSPEQIQGQDVDRRSDIFSLGIVLYELFAGKPPFTGIHSAAVTYEIINVDPPPPSSVEAKIDPELDRIVMECLQKEPADRFQSSAEVAKELRRAKRSSELLRRSPPLRPGDKPPERSASQDIPHALGAAKWLGPIAWVAVGIGVSAATLLFWKPWTPADSDRRTVERFTLPLPRDCSLELRRDGLALSPDGKHLAVIVRQDSSSFLYLRDLDQPDMKLVTSTVGLDVSGVFFSPDGQWLGFFANGKLMKLSLKGGSPVTICDALGGNGEHGGQASWGDGGTIVFMKSWGGPLWIVSAEAGSTSRQLTKLNVEAGERAHFLPRVLPGGSKALFTIWRGGDFNEDRIAVIDLNSGEYQTVMNGGTAGTYIKTGHMLFMQGSTLMAVPFDAKALRVSGDPIPVIEKVLMNGGNAFPYFCVSDNGLLVFVPGEVEFAPTTITLVDHGLTTRQIESSGAKIGFPVFSPDGNSLSVTIFGPTFQVGTFDLRKNTLTQLTFSGDNVRLLWGPDPSRIAFSSNVHGRYQISTIASDGSSAPQQLFESDGNPYPSSWTRDSKTLAYVAAGKETGFDIWLYSGTSTPATHPLIATSANEVDPRFSPDDRWLAYVSDESGASEVYVQPYPSMAGRWRISTGGGIAPKWTPDGHHILFQRNDEIISVPVAVTPGENGGSIAVGREEVFLVRKGLITFDLSPNGKTVVLGQTKTESLVDHVNIVVNWSEELKERFGAVQTSGVR